MTQGIIPGVPSDDDLRVHPAVVTREGSTCRLVTVLRRKLSTIHRGWISTTFRVDEKPGVGHIPDNWHYRVPFAKRNSGVVDEDLVAPGGLARAALPTRRPGAVPKTLCVDVVRCNAGDGLWFVVSHETGDGGVHHERDQEEEGENGNERGGAQA